MLVASMAANPVAAATYNITGVINDTIAGVTSTVFHTASGGGASGTIKALALGPASGMWDSASGAIDIAFQVERTNSGGDNGEIIDVVGTGFVLGATDPWTIDFSFFESGTITPTDLIGQSTATVTYLDVTYGTGGGSPSPNAFDLGTLTIALWGASTDTSAPYIGSDLRITLSPVPLPAGGLLLIGALGGLGALARRRRRT